jgi:hypothetical protein
MVEAGLAGAILIAPITSGIWLTQYHYQTLPRPSTGSPDVDGTDF